MAVAVEKVVEQPVRPSTPPIKLAEASLLGTVYVCLAVLLVYHGVPYVWDAYLGPLMGFRQPQGGGLFGKTLAMTISVAVGLGAAVFWHRKGPDVPGLRAGIATGVGWVLAGLIVVYLVTRIAAAICSLFIPPQHELRPWLGLVIAGATGFLWLRWMWRWFHTERAERFIHAFDEQGWFTTASYKKTQGQRIRRFTMLGILLIVLAGVYHFQNQLMRNLAGYWTVTVPFAEEYEIRVLRAPGLTISVLVTLLALWVGYRLVSYPRFADFLIATDAELNKVSWSSRKRLIQDTIVVLVTTSLLTGFLLFMDLTWAFLLRFIGVLRQ